MTKLEGQMAVAVKRRREKLIEGSSTPVYVMTGSESETEIGERVTTYTVGEPMDAWVSFETGSERIRHGRQEEDQAGLVQVGYGDAQSLSLSARSRLAYQGEVLHVHSTRDLHEVGEIMELSVTRTGEEVQ